MNNIAGKTILITGVAGFIGSFLAKQLIEITDNITIVGIDNMNDYYDVSLKEYRLSNVQKTAEISNNSFVFEKKDISNKKDVQKIFDKYKPEVVINLAAQAGVRYSIDHPDEYIESNIIGFFNILEACRESLNSTENRVEHLIYASSSSIYGGNSKTPYCEDDKVDSPVSLYAATKKSDELLAHAYSKLYGLKTTGIRFFTVYGPAGRPDMAYYSFTKKLVNGEKIEVYNYGKCKRDFTYIDDVIDGIIKIINSADRDSLYKIYNIGNNHPESLLDFISIIEKNLIEYKLVPEDYDFEDKKVYKPMQPGDVEVTYADISRMNEDFSFQPKVSLEEGIKYFVEWYKNIKCVLKN